MSLVPDSRLPDRVLDLLREQGPMTTMAVAKQTGAETRDVHDALRILVEVEDVETIPGAPVRYRARGTPPKAAEARPKAPESEPSLSLLAEPAPERKPEPAPPAPAPEPVVSDPVDAALAAIAAEPGIEPGALAERTGVGTQALGLTLGKLSRAGRAHRQGRGWHPGPATDAAQPARVYGPRAKTTPRVTTSNAVAVLETLGRLRTGGVAEDVAVSALEPLLGPADVEVLVDRIRRAPLPTLLKWAASVPA